MLAKYVASFAWTSTKNEWNAENTICSRAFVPSIARYRITRVLTIYHVKLKQSTAIEQKHIGINEKYERRALNFAICSQSGKTRDQRPAKLSTNKMEK